jgi:hypothetical protein
LKYRITPHSGFHAPADAIDALWAQLEGKRGGDIRFSKIGPEIRATWGETLASYEAREERSEAGRLAVLKAVRKVCEGADGLNVDWYAISPMQ